MRPAWMIGGLIFFLALGPGVRAEPVPYETTVSVPEVEVRSGPTPIYYATGKLHRGDKVTVVKEAEGGAFLAIKPPTGSFSWINARFLEHSGQTGQITGDDVPLRVGSELTSAKPNVEGIKVKRGLQVYILDTKPAYDDDGVWMPITPAPGEVRFLPAEAVKVTAAVQTTTSSPPEPAGGAPSDDGLWRQALQAEQANNASEAIRLYEQLGRQTNDHDLSMRCYNKSHFLREGNRAAVPPVGQPGPDGRLTPTPAYAGSQYGPPPAPPQAAGRAMSQYTYVKDVPQRPLQAQAAGYAPAPAPNPAGQWSGYGWLRRASYFLNNRPTYVLESTQGYPRIYVTADNGVNLEPYVGTNVNLYGPLVYRGDIKTNFMTVVSVAPLR